MYRYTTTTYQYNNGDQQKDVRNFTELPDGFSHLNKNFPSGTRTRTLHVDGTKSNLPDGFNHLDSHSMRTITKTGADGTTTKVVTKSPGGFDNLTSRPASSASRPASSFDLFRQTDGINTLQNRYTTSTITTTGADGITRTKVITNSDGFNETNGLADDLLTKGFTGSDDSIFSTNEVYGNTNKFAGFTRSFGSDRHSEPLELTKTNVTVEDKQHVEEASLNIHNEYRSLHQDTNSLQWDEQLAGTSQQWADYLAANNSFRHSKLSGVGENLYMFGTSDDIDITKACETAVDSWYAEIKDYDLSTHWQTGEIGHFTQAVWAGSEKLGVGVSKVHQNGLTKIYVVARYKPAGNYVGQYKENVKPLKQKI